MYKAVGHMKYLFLAAVAVIVGNAVSARDVKSFNEHKKEMSEAIDTSDYVPYSVRRAVDYNLIIAASKGYAGEIKKFLSKGANIESETDEGATPLVFSVSNDKYEASMTLIVNGADVNHVTGDYKTPVIISTINRNSNITELLLRYGADIEYKNQFGATALHLASANGYSEIVDLLLYYEADVDTKDKYGTTPLMAAIWAGNNDVADILIANGANMEARDSDGFTPFLIAAQMGDSLMVDRLKAHGVDIYEKNDSHYDALCLATMFGHENVVKQLIDMGYDKHKSGVVNPYNVAAKYKNRTILTLLEENNVPGHYKPLPNQLSIGIGSTFTNYDSYVSLRLSVKEPLYNVGLFAGFDNKYRHHKVLWDENTDDDVICQYRAKNSLVYMGAYKEFVLSKISPQTIVTASTSLSLACTCSYSLKGTNAVPPNKFKVIPSVGLNLIKRRCTFFAEAGYMKSAYYKVGPVWGRLGCSFDFYLDNIRSTGKTIKWY